MCDKQQPYYPPCSVMPKYPRLATAYVPYQVLNTIFEPMVGLQKGTIFPELVDDYKGGC